MVQQIKYFLTMNKCFAFSLSLTGTYSALGTSGAIHINRLNNKHITMNSIMRIVATNFLIIFLFMNYLSLAQNKFECGFKIDSANILSNKNLRLLLLEIENQKFNRNNNMKAVPIKVKSFLDCLAGGLFHIANPNEKWQATDVVFEENLPWRQLVNLHLNSNFVVLSYYTGGVGKWGGVLIIKYKKSEILDFWCGPVDPDSVISFENTIDYLWTNKDNIEIHGGWNKIRF